MTTQPNTCTRCGKTLYDGIHTCSPQVANTNDETTHKENVEFSNWWNERENYSMRCERFECSTVEAQAIWQAALFHARKVPDDKENE